MGYEWIESRLKDIGKSKSGLADLLGVSPARVTEILKGERKIQLSELPAIARYLGVSTDQVLKEVLGPFDKAAEHGVRTVLVVGAVQAGHWDESYDWPEDETYSVSVKIPKQFGDLQLAGFEVRGPSMDEYYPDGSVVIAANVIQIPEFQPTNGQRVIVRRRDKHGLYESTVKEYVRTDDGRHFLWPRSSHPDHQSPIELNEDDNHEEDALMVAGIVVAAIVP